MINDALGSARRLFAAIVFGFACSAPAWAEMPVPIGCTPAATSHHSLCATSTVFMCSGGIEVHTYVAGNLLAKHLHDENWMMQGYEYTNSAAMAFSKVEEGPEPTRLVDLVVNGRVKEGGKFALNTRVIRDRIYTLDGTITLSEEVVNLGGVDFRKGQIDRLFEPKPGGGGLSFQIDILVAPERNLLIEGNMTRSAFGSTPELLEQDVRAVYFEGQSGFMSMQSEYGCG